MTKNDLVRKFNIAVEERNALEEGTLTAEETAGYWLYWASHNPIQEFNNMLKANNILLSEDQFYNEVNNYLKECCN